jgi:hypothetical protein
MSTGSAGIGTVPIELHSHGPEGGANQETLNVSQVWSPDGNGAELTAFGLPHVLLADKDALKLARLLLEATQPADMPGNGYERWLRDVISIAADAIKESEEVSA